MFLINGEIANNIDVTDRGFQYGDGLFETLQVTDSHPVFFSAHLRRLQSGCQRLKIPCPDLEQLSSEVNELAQDAGQAVIKIIISRGIGGRGYRQPETLFPTRVVSIHPYPNYPQNYSQQGVAVRFCATRLGLNPNLAGIKHLNRLEQVLARSEWDDADIQEGLMLDLNEFVIEGTMTNLFYVRDGQIFTSALESSGIAGIIREMVMKLADDHLNSVVEHYFTVKDLLTADEIFLCNSVIGIWPVIQIEHNRFSIGSVTRRIQQLLDQYKLQEKLSCSG